MNKEWKAEGEAYILYFCPCGENSKCVIIAKTNDGWIFSSEYLNVEYDFLSAKTLEEAKEEVEEIVRDYLKDKISYYEDFLKMFDKKQLDEELGGKQDD